MISVRSVATNHAFRDSFLNAGPFEIAQEFERPDIGLLTINKDWEALCAAVAYPEIIAADFTPGYLSHCGYVGGFLAECGYFVCTYHLATTGTRLLMAHRTDFFDGSYIKTEDFPFTRKTIGEYAAAKAVQELETPFIYRITATEIATGRIPGDKLFAGLGDRKSVV